MMMIWRPPVGFCPPLHIMMSQQQPTTTHDAREGENIRDSYLQLEQKCIFEVTFFLIGLKYVIFDIELI